jgi:EmrB/QacA subfamily drug resistance transporter
MSETSADNRLPPGAWKIIAVVILGPLMSQMDSTIVNVSLSSIQKDLHSPIELTQWVITGYLLALALMLPLNSWLVDRLGAKKLYLLCFSSFTAASLLCGMAHTMPELIAARLIQGVAGGLLAPLTQYMMAQVAGRQMARVIGYAVIPVLIAPLLGPVLAGAILSHWGWPWLFYVNLPVGVIALVLAAIFIPGDKAAARKHSFDAKGFALISPGLALLLYGFEATAHHHPGSWVLFIGVALLIAFFRHARRQKEKALIDIALFNNKVFTAASITQFLGNGMLYAGQFLIPLFLTLGCHLSATETGWTLGAMGLGMLIVSPLMGWLTDRFGCRGVAVGGVVLNFIGTLPFLWMTLNGFSLPLALACLLVRGLGQGATGIPALSAAYTAVPKERLSLATMTINIVQRLGGPIITTCISIAVSFANDLSSERAFVMPFCALIFVQLLIAASASRLPLRVNAS